MKSNFIVNNSIKKVLHSVYIVLNVKVVSFKIKQIYMTTIIVSERPLIFLHLQLKCELNLVQGPFKCDIVSF